MARIKRIQQRLENWALWKVRDDTGALGYATRSVLASDVWSRGSYNGMLIPVIEQEAEETNRAIESLRLKRGHLFKTLELYYVKGLGILGTARAMMRAESTIKAQLEQADHAIAEWLDEQVNERERARVNVNKGSFTS